MSTIMLKPIIICFIRKAWELVCHGDGLSRGAVTPWSRGTGAPRPGPTAAFSAGLGKGPGRSHTGLSPTGDEVRKKGRRAGREAGVSAPGGREDPPCPDLSSGTLRQTSHNQAGTVQPPPLPPFSPDQGSQRASRRGLPGQPPPPGLSRPRGGPRPPPAPSPRRRSRGPPPPRGRRQRAGASPSGAPGPDGVSGRGSRDVRPGWVGPSEPFPLAFRPSPLPCLLPSLPPSPSLRRSRRRAR